MRRRDSIVLPQMAKFCPLNCVILHNTNPTDMESVFPERMEPSQINASWCLYLSEFHQQSVISCFLLNGS